MYKTSSKKRAWCKSIALIPVFIAASCVFFNKDIKNNDKMIIPGKGVSKELLTEFREKLEQSKIITKIDGKKFVAERMKMLERSQIKNPELDSLLKSLQEDTVRYYQMYYNLSSKEWDRLFVIYVQMNENQREEQEIAFAGPTFSNPHTVFPKPHSPLPEQLEFWKEMEYLQSVHPKYEIWIDGVKMLDGKTLKYSYPTTDLAGYFVSRWYTKGDRGNRLLDEYCRIYLWTPDGYEDFCKQYFDKPISIDKLFEIKPRIGHRSGDSFFFDNELIAFNDGLKRVCETAHFKPFKNAE